MTRFDWLPSLAPCSPAERETEVDGIRIGFLLWQAPADASAQVRDFFGARFSQVLAAQLLASLARAQVERDLSGLESKPICVSEHRAPIYN